MKIIHRVALSEKSEVTDALRSLGISFNVAGSPLASLIWFDIDESHPGWDKLQPLLARWQASDVVRTEFNSFERANAKCLEFTSAWRHGYPQPENDFRYLGTTYDLKEYCSTCGVGAKQIAPFRMKGEPKWGKKHVLQLNWVFDEYFVLPAIWKEVFQPLDIGCLPVLNHRTGDELRTVVQLEIEYTTKSPLSIDDKYSSEICGACHRRIPPDQPRVFPGVRYRPIVPNL